jgi:hypothetical protein
MENGQELTFENEMVEIAGEVDDTNQCELCKDATEHKCRKCGKQIYNILCSVPDPTSDNEMHRVHKKGDSRCISLGFECLNFECPTCSKYFKTGIELQEHIKECHHQISSLSLISEANSSEWMHVSCTVCKKNFENELDMNHHRLRVHES